jgi:hypothetical protein
VDKNLDYLLTEYRERINMLQNAISTGNCVNYEEYKYACGQIRGLESACLTITDLKQRMEKSND